jgi:hypothetical protein
MPCIRIIPILVEIDNVFSGAISPSRPKYEIAIFLR